MQLTDAIDWAAERKNGVLITIRRDGRPQSSDIVYAVKEGAFLISVTDGRAKTRNLRRDPRAVLHLTDPSSWTYLSFDGTATLSPTTTSPTDSASDALVEYYEAVAGKPHSDWAEYRQAMIEERRLLATFSPTSVVGHIN